MSADAFDAEYGLDGLYGESALKRCRSSRWEIAVDLVGRDVMQSTRWRRTASSTVGPDDIVPDEGFGVGQGVVDVRFRGEVNHCVGVGHQLVHQDRVGYVALDNSHRILCCRQRFAAAAVQVSASRTVIRTCGRSPVCCARSSH